MQRHGVLGGPGMFRQLGKGQGAGCPAGSLSGDGKILPVVLFMY